ncbi:MAG: histidine phosphatase family protein [Halocynthiibacter sp.]
MITRWWWVRHGPTHEKTFVGWRDVPADLTDTEQIARLDTYLPADAVLVSSDLSRAIATADAIGNGRRRLAHAVALREFDFGQWDGLGFDEVARRDPQLSREFWENPGTVAPPGGESWDMVAARVAPLVDDMTSRFAGRDIIAVAHIGTIMTQIQMASGGSAVRAIGSKIDNLSVTRLEFLHDPGEWRILGINHTP